MKTNVLFQKVSILMIAVMLPQFNSAQCSESHSTSSIFLSLGGIVGQSFTTGSSCSGFLNTISVEVKSIILSTSNSTPVVVNNAIVTVYAGNGSGGANLGSLTGITLDPNQTNTFDFSSLGIPLSASTQYTFIVNRNQPTGEVSYDAVSNALFGDTYTDGDLFFGSNQTAADLHFNVSLTPSLGIDDLQNEVAHLHLYPNPSTNFIKISGLKDQKKYDILNVLGAVISQGLIDVNNEINIDYFINGLYFIRFENGVTLKFIKT